MEKRKFLKGNDYFVFSVSGMVFCTGMLVSLRGVKWDGAMAPAFVLGFMLLLCVMMFIDGIRKDRKGIDTAADFSLKDFFQGVLLPGGTLLIACMLFHTLGFYVVTFLLVIVLLVMQDRITNGTFNLSPKRMLFCVLFALGETGFMYVMFKLLIHLPTPRGIFGF